MNNVADLLDARLDAIESAISSLATSITEADSPHADELEESIAYFRAQFERPDLTPKKRETYLRTIKLLDPLRCDPTEEF